MDAQRLNTQQVLAVGDALRDVGRVGNLHGPRGLTARERRPPVLGLEPGTAAIVVVGGRGRLGHVDGDGALVVDGGVVRKREGGAGLDVDGGGVGAGLAAGVAAQVVGGERGDGRILVCVLADVLVLAVLVGADRQLDGDVVCRDLADGQRGGDGRCEEGLHCERWR